jgi:hypothetical protein
LLEPHSLRKIRICSIAAKVMGQAEPVDPVDVSLTAQTRQAIKTAADVLKDQRPVPRARERDKVLRL